MFTYPLPLDFPISPFRGRSNGKHLKAIDYIMNHLHSNDSVYEEHHHNKQCDIRESLERAENKDENIQVTKEIR